MKKINKEEGKIVCELILNDLKYLSVRFLFFNWFFTVGAETANQLLDNTIKLYLETINYTNLIKEIRGWKGNESHNVPRIIELCINKLNLDFNFNQHRSILENIYKTYQVRYLENLEKTGEIRGLLKDIHTIDYTYKYFREKIKISDEAKNETIINKIFLRGRDLLWGEDKISLFRIFMRDNQAFKI